MCISDEKALPAFLVLKAQQVQAAEPPAWLAKLWAFGVRLRSDCMILDCLKLSEQIGPKENCQMIVFSIVHAVRGRIRARIKPS